MASKPIPQAAKARPGQVIKRNSDGSIVTYRMRVYFQKQGRAAMLSHLEIARALERVIRRAGLPYAITNGFSPHMRIAFGSALPVGVGGNRECLDVLLTEQVDLDKALAAMQASSAPALMVLGCEYIGRRDEAASVAYPYSTYETEFSEPLPCTADDLPFPQTVTVIRKKKEKVLTVSEFLQPGVELDGRIMRYVLKSGENGSLRPDVLMHELLKEMPQVRIQSITRVGQSAEYQDPSGVRG